MPSKPVFHTLGVMGRTIRAFHPGLGTAEKGTHIDLCEEESMHLARVLRVESGQAIELFDGRGGVALGSCLQVLQRQVKIEISSVESKPFPKPEIRIGVALTKAGRWDDLIRPLTELGASAIFPLLTERTEVRGESQRFQPKLQKWKKLAVEACKQSGNPWLPALSMPVSLVEFFDHSNKGGQLWIGSTGSGLKPLQPAPQAAGITLLLGPEGGWSEREENWLEERGGTLFSLGDYVLRVENAAVSALAVARSAYLG